MLPRKNGVNYSPRYINNQIRVLINGGVLSPVSNSHFLVYPMELINLKTDIHQVAASNPGQPAGSEHSKMLT